ncbi:MAG TPA: L-serine ammonia-lyase, iron-sulfur-dependent, subunit beta [Firmicutes bacterium]|jgi:L-serine dehydratase|nr:L-serine ammonia-lyase, iron-sulfur-dependent, subunit beta [Bacillota bacterium]
MAQIGLFDIVGPIMVGPSSSHTAGAVRLGLAARRILGSEVQRAQIELHGSFAATYWGHRTDVALVAGLLGMGMDDERIPEALELAAASGLEYTFAAADLGDVHPNSVRLQVEGSAGSITLCGSSIGGGRINIFELNGFEVSLDGTYSVLLTRHRDAPGVIAEVTKVLAVHGINIAFLNVSRKARGFEALLVAQTDDPIPDLAVEHVRRVSQVLAVRTLPCF